MIILMYVVLPCGRLSQPILLASNNGVLSYCALWASTVFSPCRLYLPVVSCSLPLSLCCLSIRIFLHSFLPPLLSYSIFPSISFYLSSSLSTFCLFILLSETFLLSTLPTIRLSIRPFIQNFQVNNLFSQKLFFAIAKTFFRHQTYWTNILPTRYWVSHLFLGSLSPWSPSSITNIKRMD